MPNRRTMDLAEHLDALDLNLPERLLELMPQLPAVKQADIIISLMGFLYPKRKAVEVTTPSKDSDNCIQVVFVDPAENRRNSEDSKNHI